MRCISFDSYIKPQRFVLADPRKCVVYLLTPTSNHNAWTLPSVPHQLYIFWLLHQTTTTQVVSLLHARCISFDSYIKPQLGTKLAEKLDSCISFDSYIKPQPSRCPVAAELVVYLLTPTSNHNWFNHGVVGEPVVYRLTPTSNHNPGSLHRQDEELYIFWLLHQTTTWCVVSTTSASCISFDSYIKPQLSIWESCALTVVYLLTPTSNHNRAAALPSPWWVVYLLTPTSNHNCEPFTPESKKLYIFWLLHQTTTERQSRI